MDMMKLSLRMKILLSVSLIIFIMLGINTLVHIQDLKQEYLKAIEWRSEGLAYNIAKLVQEEYEVNPDTQHLFELLSMRCADIFNADNEKDIAHVMVIDETGTIVAHNLKEFRDKSIKDPQVLDLLQGRKQAVMLSGTTYHAFVPIFSDQDEYLATVDIGVPRRVVDDKIQQLFFHSAILFGLFLILIVFSISLSIHFLLSQPVRQFVTVGQQLAEGNLVQTIQTTERGDEITALGAVFNRIANYWQNIAEVASRIAAGVLDDEVYACSDHDILGKAVQEMVHYLKHVDTIVTRVAEGDLTGTVHVRSTADTFGRAIQSMTEGLCALIVQIRASAEQIASTEKIIASLATQEIDIVQNVNNSMEHVVATINEMDASVEEVAHNMETLSSSVEETSASVSQMTSSVAHITSSATLLHDQIHQTETSLDEAVRSLGKVLEKSTDVSQQLAQGTIQDALEGQQAVEQVMNSMKTIQQTVMTAVDTITRFEQQSREIDMVLEVIREITERTSLLALNASIIAAQAGVHGRGFAVVAEEIKSLANGVSTSTKDIASIVNMLQQETTQVVQTIHTGAENVEQGMEHTRQARDTLQKIITSAQRSSSVVTEITEDLHNVMRTAYDVSLAIYQANTTAGEITAATTEHQASTRQIEQAIEQINDMASQSQQATAQQSTSIHQVLKAANDVMMLSDRNLESSQQISQTTKTVLTQADMLLHSVDRFKLREES